MKLVRRIAIWGQKGMALDAMAVLFRAAHPHFEVTVLPQDSVDEVLPVVDKIVRSRAAVVLLKVDSERLAQALAVCGHLATEGATHVVVHSMSPDCSKMLLPFLRAGTTGWVVNACSTSDLIKVVEAAALGKRHFPPAVSEILVEELLHSRAPAIEPQDGLSVRERQVLKLLAFGFVHKEIAEKLGISPKTVEAYHGRLAVKLKVHGRAAVFEYARTHGYLDFPGKHPKGRS